MSVKLLTLFISLMALQVGALTISEFEKSKTKGVATIREFQKELEKNQQSYKDKKEYRVAIEILTPYLIGSQTPLSQTRVVCWSTLEESMRLLEKNDRDAAKRKFTTWKKCAGKERLVTSIEQKLFP